MSVRPLLALLALAALAPQARASAGCMPAAAAEDLASRIAAVACAEHALWYAPFIDERGRLAGLRISEAENLRLADRSTPAWRRVARYWRDSGVRWPGGALARESDCDAEVGTTAASLCRVTLVDTPWSAVFVSYVLGQAGVPGFEPSARHVDYVRAAHRRGDVGPYRLADPDSEAPAVGDLLCFSRVAGQVFGPAGFRDWLGRPFGGALAMHCDIVVSTDGGRARVVGGNVLQGVTMRLLPVNRSGRFWALPRRTAADPGCSPARPEGCDLNRQDWVALLKLDPVLARSPAPGRAPAALPEGPCCVVCTLPMAEGMRRCPAPPAPQGATTGD